MNSPKFLFFLIFVSSLSFAQKTTQTITGIVKDKLTKQVLPGASIIIEDIEPQVGTLTDEVGRVCFRKMFQ